MNRRGLLAAIGAATASTLAGCGYAPGGGDIVDDAQVGPTGGMPWTTTSIDTTADRIAYATSGESAFDSSASTSLYIADRSGTQLERYTYGAASEAVVLDPSAGRAYLLATSTGQPDEEEATGVATVDLTREDRSHPYVRVENIVSGESIPDGEPHSGRGVLAANGSGAYCLVEDGFAAVGPDDERWRHEVDGAGRVVADRQVVVATENGVRAFDDDGSERWQRDTDERPAVASAGGRTAVHADGELRVFDVDGNAEWQIDLTPDDPQLRFEDDRLLVEWGSRLAVVDVGDGTVQWDESAGVSVPAVWDGDRAYSVRDCEVVATDEDGEWWRRQLELDGCAVVDGWVDGERVAFLFESGAIRWLRRTDEEPGLLW